MSALDNMAVIHGKIYPFLNSIGLHQNREKFTLPAAGPRGYSIDVGSSYGEVMIRIIDDGQLADRLSITKFEQVDATLDVVALAVQRKKAALQEAEMERLSDTEEQLAWEGLDARDRAEAEGLDA
jgi:hypothetical protein